MRIAYLAFDDKLFANEVECRAYETQHFEQCLVGLTIEQVKAALSRSDAYLADAFERAGTQIAKGRRESGELRRTRKPDGNAAPVAEEQKTAPDASDEVQEYQILELARVKAAEGRRVFDAFYNRLTADQLDELAPEMPALMKIARQAVPA